MTRQQVDLAIEWAAKEGWNPGLYDAECFFATDPKGFFMGFLDGEPIGCISTVAYDHQYSFLGLYIVRPEFRGRGYGLRIWNFGMQYLGHRNVGLDGVIAQQENYKKSGFKLAYRNIRYEGIASGKMAPGITALTHVAFDELLSYDRKLFPTPRAVFLKRWIDQPQGTALGVVSAGRLVGYGVIRACRKGYKIGPLFADDEQIAEHLFQALTSEIRGQPFYLDIPEVNPAAKRLVERHEMNVVFETARMYTKNFPIIDLPRIFGVTTFEVG